MKRFCVLALTLLLTHGLFAAEKIRVAVLDLQAKNAPKELASAVSDFIRVELMAYDVYELLDRDNMNIILKEQAFQQSGCTSAECAVEIGQILNCQYMFVGALSKIGKVFYVSMQRVNIETGRVDFADKREVDSEDALAKASADLTGAMASGIVKKKKVWRDRQRSWRIDLGLARLSFGEQLLLVDGVERSGEQVAGAYGVVIGFRYCPGWRSRFTFGVSASMGSPDETISEYVVNNVSYDGNDYTVSYRGRLFDVIAVLEGRLYYDISDRIGWPLHTLKLMAGAGVMDRKMELETVAVNSTQEAPGTRGSYGGHPIVSFETLGIALSWWKCELVMAMRFHNDEMIIATDRLNDDTDEDKFPVPPREFVLPQGRSTSMSLGFLF